MCSSWRVRDGRLAPIDVPVIVRLWTNPNTDCYGRGVVTTHPVTRTLTTSEAAVLALLGLDGAGSGYELTKRVGRAIGHVWAPARSQLYALLPRLVADGLVRARTVRQETRPDKQVYTLTRAVGARSTAGSPTTPAGSRRSTSASSSGR